MPEITGRRPGARRAAALAIVILALLAPTWPVRAADRPTVGGEQLATTGTAVDPLPGAPALPAITAAGWLVADLDTGQVLAAHDPHGRYAPASTLKILTAYTVIPQLAPTRAVVATSAEVNVDGTRVGIVPGHAYTVATLLQGMLMVSGNDAARVLAGALGGSPAVVAQMNAQAASLNARDTHAVDVTGLDAPAQTSSAYDLALIARAALTLPAFATDVATRRAQFAGAGVKGFEIDSHNPLLGRVPGVYGVKNGYTVAAQASYVGTARRDGHQVMVVLIRDRPDFAPEATALLHWGFAARGMVTPVGTLVPAGPLAATPGARVAAVGATSARAVAARTSGMTGALTEVSLGLLAGLAVVALVAGRRRQLRQRRSRRYARRWTA